MTDKENRKQIEQKTLEKLKERRRIQAELDEQITRSVADRDEVRDFVKFVAEETGANPLDVYMQILEKESENIRKTKRKLKGTPYQPYPKELEYLRGAGGRVFREIDRRKAEEKREYLKKCRELARADLDAPFPTELLFDIEKLDKYAKLLKDNDRVAICYKVLAQKKTEYANVFDAERGETVLREVPSQKLMNRARSVAFCAARWTFDSYPLSEYYDLKSIPFCHDRFCRLCQNKLSNARYTKYKDLFVELSGEHDLYHLTLTQPNVGADVLAETVNLMFISFKKLAGYFSGHKGIRGAIFPALGYWGMLRTFELTIAEDGSYHPHFHVMLMLRKGLNLSRKYVNVYSHNKKEPKKIRKFTDLEIMLQKVWRLLMSGEEVTRKSIDALPLGYSCECTLAGENNYHEVFKYAVKPPKDSAYSTAAFETMREALKGRKMFQGYGGLYRVKDVDLNENDVRYDREIGRLREREEPVEVSLTRDEVYQAIKAGKKVMSRKMYHRDALEEEQKDEEVSSDVSGEEPTAGD